MSVCPVCHRTMPFNPRYPRAICQACVNCVVDEDQRPVEFFNEGMSGGIFGLYKDDGSPYPSTVCYIRGARCNASEAHMGGIVIELID